MDINENKIISSALSHIVKEHIQVLKDVACTLKNCGESKLQEIDGQTIDYYQEVLQAMPHELKDLSDQIMGKEHANPSSNNTFTAPPGGAPIVHGGFPPILDSFDDSPIICERVYRTRIRDCGK